MEMTDATDPDETMMSLVADIRELVRRLDEVLNATAAGREPHLGTDQLP